MRFKRLFRLPWRTARSIEREVDAELRFHLEERTARLMATGLAPHEAETRARAEFGDIDDARRYMNAVDRETESNRRRRDYMDELMQDITYALRKLKSAPVFALTVILTLSVGIGGTTTVMNLINIVLVRPPAISDPDNVAWITPMHANGRFEQWSYPDFADYRAQAKSWSAVFGQGNIGVTIGGAEPYRINGLAVSASYFDALGVRPHIGRGFIASEDEQGATDLPLVISYPLWRRRFNADSTVIGKPIEVNRLGATIVGVAAEDFNGLRVGEQVDFWIPLAAVPRLGVGRADMYTWRGTTWFMVAGRLKDGVGIDQAAAEASVIGSRIWDASRRERERRTLGVSLIHGGMHPAARQRVGTVLLLVMIVPFLVLGVACANVANLFIARAVQRQKELAVRRALGASRGRLVRQLLTECAILGVLAGFVGLTLSYGLTAVMQQTAALPQDVARLLVPDAFVITVTLGIALAAGTLFGLMPALAATKDSITPALKSDGITVQFGRGRHRLRNAFVVSQTALSLTLLIAAGLFVGSLQKALRVEPGFDASDLLVTGFDLSGQSYDANRIQRFSEQLVARVSASPAIAGAGAADVIPLSGGSSSTMIRRAAEARGVSEIQSYNARVTPGYFATMKIQLVRGRFFAASDVAGSTSVAVISERLAAMLWPGQDPVGKLFVVGDRTAPVEIVGVARNGKVRTLAEPEDLPFFWTPDAQDRIGTQGTLVVRTKGSNADAILAIRAAFADLDPALPIGAIEAYEAKIARTVDGQRAGAALLGVFGIIGLLLAAFGIFGVIAQGVAARTREIGIRMSLGARAIDVVRSFVREGLVLTTIGAALGVVLSLALSRVLSSLLFGLTATDTLTFIGATAGLLTVAALASFLPARRAAKVDPLVALRTD